LKTGFFRRVKELKIQRKNPGSALPSGKDLTLTSIALRSLPVLMILEEGCYNYSLRSGRDFTPTYIGVKICPSLEE
jgi:hypothetical protein